MPERSRRGIVVIPLVVLVTVVAAVVAVELRGGESFGLGRHDEQVWTRVFDEEFDGDQLDAERWNRCHWWDDGGCTISSNEELQWYLPEQVAVSGGRLALTAERHEATAPDGTVHPFRSGMVTTGPPEYQDESRFDFLYGRVEARVRVPAGQGLWSAFWMLPSTSESRPEIDILESLGHDPSELIFHFHPTDRTLESDGHRYRGPDLSAGWHDIGVDWEPQRLRWFVDGKQVWEITGDRVPSEPMYLVFNLAVGGVYPGEPSADTTFPATYEIERVTVWQRPT